MAWAEKHQNKWRAGWREGQRTRKKTGFATRPEAEAFGWARESEWKRGESPREPSKVEFGPYAEQWLASRRFPAATEESAGAKLKHAVRRFGNRPIASITRAEIKTWCTDLHNDPQPPFGRPLSAATVRQVYHYFQAVLREAINEDHLRADDPCLGLKLTMLGPKPRKRLYPVPEPEEVDQVVAEMPERYRAIALLAAEIGMRQGEIFGLTRDRVDIPGRTIRVDRQYQTVTGVGAHMKDGAKHGTDRIIPVVEGCDAFAILAAHMLAFPSSHPEGLIFTTARGEGLRRNNFNEVWRRANARAGTKVRFHDLRGYAVSVLAKMGVQDLVISEMMGHNLDTLRSHYRGLFAGDLVEELSRGYARRNASRG